jgi:hypothetical protein
VKGKTPRNLAVGLFAVTPRGVSSTLPPLESSDRWKVQKNPARDIMQNQLSAAAAPARVARTMTAGATAAARPTGDGNSAIVYDRTGRRFANAENPQSAKQGMAGVRIAPEQSRSGSATSQVPAAAERVSGREGQRDAGVPGARSAPPARAAVPPPSVPRSVSTQRVFNENGGGGGGSRGGSNSASGASSRGTSASSSSSATAASSGSGSRASSSSGSGGGGRPH